MFDTWTVDRLERTLVEAEQRIGRLRAMQMALLDRLDVAQVARLDGSRNLVEWVAARADVDQPTARNLVRTARTTAERPELRIPLAEGDVSFARCAATARLAATGASPEAIHRSAGHDIAGVHRLASRHRTFTQVDEREVFERRHLAMQSSLDDAMGRIYGEFAGYEWRLIEKAITERAHAFPVERVLCNGAIEAIGIHEDGTPLALGRTTPAIPPKLRRFILNRDGSCTIDGCASRYRLEIHHIRSWADGGRTDPDNLTTLCWYHHLVVVHGRGFRIDESSPPQRRRFLRPLAGRAPPTMVA